MNKDEFTRKWHEWKGKVKEKWGNLTDEDITRVKGKMEELSARLQERYGWAKERAEKEINDWQIGHRNRGEGKTVQWNETETSKEKKRRAG